MLCSSLPRLGGRHTQPRVSGIGVEGFGFRVEGFRGSGSRDLGSGFRILGFRDLRIVSRGFRVLGCSHVEGPEPEPRVL